MKPKPPKLSRSGGPGGATDPEVALPGYYPDGSSITGSAAATTRLAMHLLISMPVEERRLVLQWFCRYCCTFNEPGQDCGCGVDAPWIER